MRKAGNISLTIIYMLGVAMDTGDPLSLFATIHSDRQQIKLGLHIVYVSLTQRPIHPFQ